MKRLIFAVAMALLLAGQGWGDQSTVMEETYQLQEYRNGRWIDMPSTYEGLYQYRPNVLYRYIYKWKTEPKWPENPCPKCPDMTAKPQPEVIIYESGPSRFQAWKREPKCRWEYRRVDILDFPLYDEGKTKKYIADDDWEFVYGYEEQMIFRRKVCE